MNPESWDSCISSTAFGSIWGYSSTTSTSSGILRLTICRSWTTSWGVCRRVSRRFGACHADSAGEIEDVAYLNLDFGDGLLASFHVNWLSPVKIRHFVLGGSQKSLVYNDLAPGEKIKVYDRGIAVAGDAESRRGALVSYRMGDVWSPHIEQTEPLARMTSHFAKCIQERSEPLSGGEAGLRIVQILRGDAEKHQAQGGRITL